MVMTGRAGTLMKVRPTTSTTARETNNAHDNNDVQQQQQLCDRLPRLQQQAIAPAVTMRMRTTAMPAALLSTVLAKFKAARQRQ
jgi:hypothetical protein